MIKPKPAGAPLKENAPFEVTTGSGKAKKVVAKIYYPSPNYPYHRLVYYAGAKRVLKSFASFKAAKKEADELAPSLAKRNAIVLTPAETRDALGAFDRLEAYRKAGGEHMSLLAAVSEYCDLKETLRRTPVAPGTEISLRDALERFLSTVATVQRKDLKQAVSDYIESRKHLSQSQNGERAQMSPVYAYNVGMWLNEFAGTFPGHAVCDLAKSHLGMYINSHSGLSAKSRNDRRAVVKMFLGWCVAKDYLPVTHRLFEAPEFKRERNNIEEIQFYTPKELRVMLEAASNDSPPGSRDLLPVLALGALAGLRVEEIFRLSWEDLWRVRGKIEIGAKIAKGRKRRLVTMGASLAKWLNPYRNSKGPVWSLSSDAFHEGFGRLRDTLKIPARRNGLRHGFVTYHMAVHRNENLTAAEAGNSPQMLHQHYRALATNEDGKKWFAVSPTKPTNVISLIPTAATQHT